MHQRLLTPVFLLSHYIKILIFLIFFLLFNLLACHLLATCNTSKIAEKRLTHTSILESLHFISAFPNSPIKDSLLKKAINNFFLIAGGEENIADWNRLPLHEQDSLSEIILEASKLLMSDTFSTEYSHTHHLASSQSGEQKTSTNRHICYDELLKKYLSLTQELKNRKLAGFSIGNRRDISQTPSEQIDLFRAISIEYATNNNQTNSYSIFEIALDLIAVDAQYRMNQKHASYSKDIETLVDSLNTILFYELHIRFPPLSASEKYIDQFSNIEEILISKRGVCLGVSAIYIAILQRLGITPIIYTPPGHIFIAVTSQNRSEGKRVIETTARGIHLPITHYLDSRISEVPVREIKDVIAMVLTNDAARSIREEDFAKAYRLYENAAIYVTYQDADFLSFWSLIALLNHKKDIAKTLANKALQHQPYWSLDGLPLAYDISQELLSYNQARVLVECIKADRDIYNESLLSKIENSLDINARKYTNMPVTLLELKADILLKKMDTHDALETLSILYKRWKLHSIDSPSFIGLPSLMLLSQLEATRSNIDKAAFYLKEAYLFRQKREKCIQRKIEPTKEMCDMLMFISQKSPYSLEGISLETAHKP